MNPLWEFLDQFIESYFGYMGWKLLFERSTGNIKKISKNIITEHNGRVHQGQTQWAFIHSFFHLLPNTQYIQGPALI